MVNATLDSLRDKASKTVTRAKSAVGMKTNEEPTVVEEVSEFCPKLTYKERLYGFGFCFTIGYLITFMSFKFFEDLIAGNPVPYVILYTFGNCISLLSSMFLCGPKRQFQRMFDDTRKITTIIYLSSLLASIIVCFLPLPSNLKLIILVLLLLTQLLASIWYTMSYIPLARRAFKRCVNRELGEEGA